MRRRKKLQPNQISITIQSSIIYFQHFIVEILFLMMVKYTKSIVIIFDFSKKKYIYNNAFEYTLDYHLIYNCI